MCVCVSEQGEEELLECCGITKDDTTYMRMAVASGKQSLTSPVEQQKRKDDDDDDDDIRKKDTPIR